MADSEVDIPAGPEFVNLVSAFLAMEPTDSLIGLARYAAVTNPDLFCACWHTLLKIETLSIEFIVLLLFLKLQKMRWRVGLWESAEVYLEPLH